MTQTSDASEIPSVNPQIKAAYEKSLIDHKTLESARQRGLFEQEQGRKEIERIAAEVQERFGMSIDEIPDYIRRAVPQNEDAMKRFTAAVDKAMDDLEVINRHRAG